MSRPRPFRGRRPVAAVHRFADLVALTSLEARASGRDRRIAKHFWGNQGAGWDKGDERPRAAGLLSLSSLLSQSHGMIRRERGQCLHGGEDAPLCSRATTRGASLRVTCYLNEVSRESWITYHLSWSNQNKKTPRMRGRLRCRAAG